MVSGLDSWQIIMNTICIQKKSSYMLWRKLIICLDVYKRQTLQDKQDFFEEVYGLGFEIKQKKKKQ